MVLDLFMTRIHQSKRCGKVKQLHPKIAILVRHWNELTTQDLCVCYMYLYNNILLTSSDPKRSKSSSSSSPPPPPPLAAASSGPYCSIGFWTPGKLGGGRGRRRRRRRRRRRKRRKRRRMGKRFDVRIHEMCTV